MCKAADRGMVMGDIRVLEKSGGKSGDWVARPAWQPVAAARGFSAQVRNSRQPARGPAPGTGRAAAPRVPRPSQTSKNSSACGLRNSRRRCARWRALSSSPSLASAPPRPSSAACRAGSAAARERRFGSCDAIVGGGHGGVVGMVAEQPAALAGGDALGQRRRVLAAARRSRRRARSRRAPARRRAAAAAADEQRSASRCRAATRAPCGSGAGAPRHKPNANAVGSRKWAYHSGYSSWLCTRHHQHHQEGGAQRQAADGVGALGSPARQARHSAQPSSASTSSASGRPSSTANCSGRLCVWSKNATGRSGNGVSDQAKLNSPQPTPNHGWLAISASVFDQIAKRELEMSPFASWASPPKTCWLACAQAAPAPPAARRRTATASAARAAARQPPVQQAPQRQHQHAEHAGARGAEHDARPAAARPAPAPRRHAPALGSHTSATSDHNSRLLRWFGWRRLPAARPTRADLRDPCRRAMRREHLDDADRGAEHARDHQPMQKARNAARLGRRALQRRSISSKAVATSVPSADSARRWQGPASRTTALRERSAGRVAASGSARGCAVRGAGRAARRVSIQPRWRTRPTAKSPTPDSGKSARGRRCRREARGRWLRPLPLPTWDWWVMEKAGFSAQTASISAHFIRAQRKGLD